MDGLIHDYFIKPQYLIHTSESLEKCALYFTSWFNMCTGHQEPAEGQ